MIACKYLICLHKALGKSLSELGLLFILRHKIMGQIMDLAGIFKIVI